MALKTFLTLGFAARPLPPDSAIVGSAELLFRLNDPKRSERDKERDSGLNRCSVEPCEPLGEDDEDGSAAFRSSSVVTNLSRSSRSASLLEARLEPSAVGAPVGSTSESCETQS